MKQNTFISALTLSLFLPLTAHAELVTCESTGPKKQECAIDTSDGVRLHRQLGDTPCKHDKSWGVTKKGVWVAEGCRAEFETGAASRERFGKENSTAVLKAACVAEASRYLRINKPDIIPQTFREMGKGLFEISLKTPQKMVVCTVDKDRKVRTVVDK